MEVQAEHTVKLCFLVIKVNHIQKWTLPEQQIIFQKESTLLGLTRMPRMVFKDSSNPHFVLLLSCCLIFCTASKDVMNMRCGLQAILNNKSRVEKQQNQGCHE